MSINLPRGAVPDVPTIDTLAARFPKTLRNRYFEHVRKLSDDTHKALLYSSDTLCAEIQKCRVHLLRGTFISADAYKEAVEVRRGQHRRIERMAFASYVQGVMTAFVGCMHELWDRQPDLARKILADYETESAAAEKRRAEREKRKTT